MFGLLLGAVVAYEDLYALPIELAEHVTLYTQVRLPLLVFLVVGDLLGPGRRQHQLGKLRLCCGSIDVF